MKKVIFVAILSCIGIFSFAGTNQYTLNDASVDQLFAQSEDISASVQNEITSFSDINVSSVNKMSGGQNVGGYLIRSFFCGWIALHRSYMGTNGTALWWMYFCIPVAGQVVGFVDFWWVVFLGEDAMNKYKNNSRFVVWLE